MQAFLHLTLFTLLFQVGVISGASNARAAPTTPTGASNATAAPATPPGASNATAAPATPPGASNATAAPATPPGASNATAAPATPPGASNATAAPATPPGASNATAAPATPPGASNATAAPATPPGASNATAAPATPPGASNATAAPATPPGASNATAAPATPPGASNATAAPATPPGASNATAAPATPPGASNATAAPATPPGASNATAAPATPPGASNATAAPATPSGASNATALPATTAGANNTTVVPATTAAPTDLCRNDSCTGGSFCVNLNNTHFCQCISGYYYNSSSCKKGKVFPGIIQVKITDTSGLENKMSMNYENLHMKVNKFFEGAFKDYDYGQTLIQQVSISASARSQMRADDKVVSVTVVNLFAEDTKENETTISNIIRIATSSNSGITNYASQDRCEFYGCVKENDCSDGFQCKCRTGYERPNPHPATCVPLSRRCPYACNSKPNTQCLVKDDGNPVCVCLAGYKKDDHEKCQVCAFGYGGVNCEDNLQLILTIVGTVAGILILGMVIALILMRSKKTKEIEEQNLIENDFQNLKLQQTTGFSFPAEVGIFPKVTSNFPRASAMHNPYANPRGIPRPDY